MCKSELGYNLGENKLVEKMSFSKNNFEFLSIHQWTRCQYILNYGSAQDRSKSLSLVVFQNFFLSSGFLPESNKYDLLKYLPNYQKALGYWESNIVQTINYRFRIEATFSDRARIDSVIIQYFMSACSYHNTREQLRSLAKKTILNCLI